MKKIFSTVVLMLLVFCATDAFSQSLQMFKVRTVTKEEFYTFIKVFSEMRGPLRTEILKDKATDFKDADPLKYLMKVKGEKDVQKALKENKLSWDQFNELTGNILLGYFSNQPQNTKAMLLKQLSGYGLAMADDQIPAEYRPMVAELLKSDAGATLAAMAIETILQIPQENKDLAKKNQRTLDQLFYTRFWKDAVGK